MNIFLKRKLGGTKEVLHCTPGKKLSAIGQTDDGGNASAPKAVFKAQVLV